MKKISGIFFAGFVFSIHAAPCVLGPDGINQWQLIYQVGECVNTSTEILCSKIEALGSFVDTGCCSLLEASILSTTDLLKSDIDSVSTKIDLVSSQIDLLSSKSDACCSVFESELASISDVLSSQSDVCCSQLESVIGSVTDVLKSDIDSVSIKVDGVNAQVTSCCNMLSAFDQIIISDVDSISTKVDSVSSHIDLLSSKSDICCSILENELSSIGDVLSTQSDVCCSQLESVIGSVTDVLKSDIDSVSIKVDGVNAQVTSCCNMLSAFDQIIISDVDNVSTKIDLVSSQIDLLSSKSDACCSLLESELTSISDVLSSQSDVCCSQLESVIVSVTDVLKSDIDSVSIKVDGVNAQVTSCCNMLSAFDQIIISDVDSVSSKVDSVSSHIDLLSSKSDVCCSLLDETINSANDVLGSQSDVCCSVLESVILSTTDVLKSDVDSVSSQVDTLSQQTTAMSTCLFDVTITQSDLSMGTYIIAQSGIYTVCENLTGAFNLISIQANNVVLDLNGHTLNSTAGSCVVINGNSNVTVKNGYCTATQKAIDCSVVGSSIILIEDIVAFNTAEPCIHCIQAIDVNILNCLIDGYNTTQIVSGMIRIDGCRGVLIQDCKVVGRAFPNRPVFAYSIVDPQSTNGSGIVLRRCLAQSVREVGFSVQVITSGSLNSCLFEQCVASDSTGTLRRGFDISDIVGASGCQLIDCSADGQVRGFLLGRVTGMYLEGCVAKNNVTSGFDIGPLANDTVIVNCVAMFNPDTTGGGFFVRGSRASLCYCKATKNYNGFNLFGTTDTTIENSLASYNNNAGINNLGTGTVLVNLVSSNLTTPSAPAYQLNTAPDVIGTAVRVEL